MKNVKCSLIGVGLLCTGVLVSVPAIAAVDIIHDIQVEAQGATGTAAKDAAFAQARLKAVQQALEHLGRPGDKATAALADRATTFIDVNSEKAAGNTYTATVNVGIEISRLPGGTPSTAAAAPPVPAMPDTHPDLAYEMPKQVPNYAAPLPAGKTLPGWVLVVPVHRTADGPVVWSNTDPWIASWGPSERIGAIDLVTSAGDESDQKLLPRDAAATGDAKALQRMAAKYQAPAVAVVALDTAFAEDPEHSGVVEVDYWTAESGRVSIRSDVNGGTFIDLAHHAVQQAILGLVDPSHSNTGASPHPSIQSAPANTTTGFYTPPQPAPMMAHQPITITVNDTAHWQSIAQSINEIPGASASPSLISKHRVDLTVDYAGSEASLMQELQQRGLPH